jgi:rhamnosyl/mannosyltransferase
MPALRELVRQLGLESRVLLLGWVSDAEATHLHAAASIFCLPSTARAEAFGLALLESMAHGVPAVRSRINGSGIAYVSPAEVCCTEVTPLDPAALAGALERLLADQELSSRLGSAARERFLMKFSAAEMADRIDAVYRRVQPHTNQ